MRHNAWLVLIMVLLLAATSCAPGPNPLERSGQAAGFWLGFWHGLISPLTFVISIFNSRVNLYEVHNSGGWYNFGFVLGAGLFLSGGILGHRRRRR